MVFFGGGDANTGFWEQKKKNCCGDHWTCETSLGVTMVTMFSIELTAKVTLLQLDRYGTSMMNIFAFLQQMKYSKWAGWKKSKPWRCHNGSTKRGCHWSATGLQLSVLKLKIRINRVKPDPGSVKCSVSCDTYDMCYNITDMACVCSSWMTIGQSMSRKVSLYVCDWHLSLAV